MSSVRIARALCGGVLTWLNIVSTRAGLEWKDALAQGIVFNAKQACVELGIDSAQLDTMWATAKREGKLVKFGGGFYW